MFSQQRNTFEVKDVGQYGIGLVGLEHVTPPKGRHNREDGKEGTQDVAKPGHGRGRFGDALLQIHHGATHDTAIGLDVTVQMGKRTR